jgi:hypothetical protein
VFGSAFVLMTAAFAIAPSLVLGAYQDEFVQAWNDAGVDTSACDGSVPQLGLGVQSCYKGAMQDLAAKINAAGEDSESAFDASEE